MLLWFIGYISIVILNQINPEFKFRDLLYYYILVVFLDVIIKIVVTFNNKGK